MHILIGALAILVTLLILLKRLADAGIDLGGLNPFLWRRHREWRGKFEANPLFLVSDPREIAAILAVGIAKIDGDMTADDKRLLLQEFETTFSVKPRGASELLGSSVHLLGDPAILLTQLDAVLARGRDKFSSEQVISTLAMLERIAGASGNPSPRQRELIDAVRGRLGSMKPVGTWG